VGGGASQCAGGGDASKQRGDDVADALGDEFVVGIVLGSGHAVGNDCGEQRFDGAEHRDGQRGGGQFAEQGHGEGQGFSAGSGKGPGQRGDGGQRRDAFEGFALDGGGELRVDGGDGKVGEEPVQQGVDDGRGEKRDQWRGDAR